MSWKSLKSASPVRRWSCLCSWHGGLFFDVPADERSWILTDQYGTGEWHGPSDAKEGTALPNIQTLKYSTFISEEFPENGEQVADVVPSLQIMAAIGDVSGEYDFVGLVFDPPSADAVTGQWQKWDAMDHNGWRVSAAWADPRETELSNASWEKVLEEYGDAKVLWAIGIAAGTWPGKDFHGYADLLTVGVDGKGTTTYNFDVNPYTKDDCKDGRWEDHGFKNQGQCIRYVNTDQDSR